MKFVRITVNPLQMGGVPCMRGLRIPVATIIEMLADGMTPNQVLTEFPDLEAADIDEALHFAADAVRERQLPFVRSSEPEACEPLEHDSTTLIARPRRGDR